MWSHDAYKGCRHYAVSQLSMASGFHVVTEHDHLRTGARAPSLERHPSPNALVSLEDLWTEATLTRHPPTRPSE